MGSQKRKLELWPFGLLAFLLHYVVFTLVPMATWRAQDISEETLDIELAEAPAPATPEEAAAEARHREEQRKELEAEERTPEGQVVEIPPPREEQRPDKSRFVSEHDSKVERETKAPPGARKPGRAGEPGLHQPVRRDAQAPPPSALAMRERSQPVPPHAGEPIDEREDAEAPRAPSGTPPGTAPPPQGGLPSMRALQPTEEQLSKALGVGGEAGGGGSDDYLDEVEAGGVTALNTKRWRFASFFNRVKRQVADNWHPEVAYRRRDPYGNVYGFRDRITVLRVQLDPDGSLRDLDLDHPSGVEFLDDEAIDAFRAAQPFPNPPRQLVNPETGFISFRFGFVFEINSSPTFRVFRYSD